MKDTSFLYYILGVNDPDLQKFAACGRAKTTSHRCRNLHRVIHKTGKKLNVKVSTVRIWIRYSKRRVSQALVDYPVLRMPDWVNCIFRSGGHFFLGGKGMEELASFQHRLVEFWQNYKVIDPSFPFLNKMPKGCWAQSIPIAIHGDEGRGRHKTPIMVVSVQPLMPLDNFKSNMKGNLGDMFIYMFV